MYNLPKIDYNSFIKSKYYELKQKNSSVMV